MIEPWFAPAHAHPFEALLNEPLAGAFHPATANRQTGGFELVILNMSFVRFQIVIHVGSGFPGGLGERLGLDQGRPFCQHRRLVAVAQLVT